MPAPLSVSASGFFLFFMLFSANGREPTLAPQSNGTSVIASEEAPMVPMIEAGKLDAMMWNGSRRRLGSFRICAVCTCCGGAKGLCLATPCCYAINCNIPNRPFGFCSFTPQTCNCFGCHL